MGKINAEWHKANVMAKNPTFDQRAKWHIEHAKNCSCRLIPPKLAAELKEKGYL